MFLCFFFLACLRALFLGDNDLTAFPPKMEKFVHLEVVRLQKRELFQSIVWNSSLVCTQAWFSSCPCFGFAWSPTANSQRQWHCGCAHCHPCVHQTQDLAAARKSDQCPSTRAGCVNFIARHGGTHCITSHLQMIKYIRKPTVLIDGWVLIVENDHTFSSLLPVFHDSSSSLEFPGREVSFQDYRQPSHWVFGQQISQHQAHVWLHADRGVSEVSTEQE